MAEHRTVDQPAAGAFHLGNGWYIRRSADGSVTITSEANQEEATFTVKQWTRGVASVTAGGYSDASAAAALALHQGG